jgi:hypothetical protein
MYNNYYFLSCKNHHSLGDLELDTRFDLFILFKIIAKQLFLKIETHITKVCFNLKFNDFQEKSFSKRYILIFSHKYSFN